MLSIIKLIFSSIIPFLLGVVLVAIVFFSETFLPLVLILMVLVSFFSPNFKSNVIKNNKLFFPFLAYVFVTILYTAFSPVFLDALKILERQTSFLVIPLIVFSFSWNINKVQLFFKTYLFSLLVVGVISVIKLAVFVYNYSDWIDFMNESSNNFTYVQFKYPHLMGAHPTYWSYLLIIANIILLHYKKFGLFKSKVTSVVLLIAFTMNLFYLSARTPIVICLIIYLCSFVYFIYNNRAISKKIISIAVIFFLIVCFFLFSQPLFIFKFTNFLHDDRLFLWPKAFEIIADNYFILGEGVGYGNQLLQEYIFTINDPRDNYFGFDLHNQYLKNYIDMGVLGISATLYMLFYPMFLAYKKSRGVLYGLSIVLLFGLCMFTESSLYVIKGIVIYTIVSSIAIQIINGNYFASNHSTLPIHSE